MSKPTKAELLARIHELEVEIVRYQAALSRARYGRYRDTVEQVYECRYDGLSVPERVWLVA
ncbi:hypothetical protein LCGC14_2415370 [marine sediment metagenome]|uniref:Uncharacterized protein n=1 Tax=marine sediment metagenome TaxID=412755 RepID=A0A0F9E3F5_9ZZZZ